MAVFGKCAKAISLSFTFTGGIVRYRLFAKQGRAARDAAYPAEKT
jgi:hypothetical protein